MVDVFTVVICIIIYCRTCFAFVNVASNFICFSFFRSYYFFCGVWWCVSESAQDGCNCCFCICTIVYWKRLISNCTKSRVVVVPIDLMTTNQSIHSVMFCFCVVLLHAIREDSIIMLGVVVLFVTFNLARLFLCVFSYWFCTIVY